MSRVKTLLLGVLAAVLTVTAVLTWGSIGSALCIYCLIVMGASLLYQRFLTNRDEDRFQE